MDNFNIELNGILEEYNLDIMLNEFSIFNNNINKDNILNEGIKDIVKTIKDKIVKFFKWLIDKITDFFKNYTMNGFVAHEVNIKIINDYKKATDFFVYKYRGEEIEFGKFAYLDEVNHIKDLYNPINLTEMTVIITMYENHVKDISLDDKVEAIEKIKEYDEKYKKSLNKFFFNDENVKEGSILERLISNFAPAKNTNDYNKLFRTTITNKNLSLAAKDITSWYDIFSKDLRKDMVEKGEKPIIKSLNKTKDIFIQRVEENENDINQQVISTFLTSISGVISDYLQILTAFNKIEKYWTRKTLSFSNKIIFEWKKLGGEKINL